MERRRRAIRESGGALPPEGWVEATEPLVRRLALQGVSVSTEQILRGLAEAEAGRAGFLLGEGGGAVSGDAGP